MKKTIFTIFTFLFLINVNAQENKEISFNKTDELLSEIVKKSIVLAEKTGNFVIEQAPLLLKEFYYWHITSNIFWIIFSILIFLIGRYLPYQFGVKEETKYKNEKFFGRYFFESAPFWILFSITSTISLILFTLKVYNLIFILVAPKLYLIEYFLNKH